MKDMCLLALSPKPPSCPPPYQLAVAADAGSPGVLASSDHLLHCGQDATVYMAPRPCWLFLQGPCVPWELQGQATPSHPLLYAKGPQIYLQPPCFPKPKTDAHSCPLTISPGAQ